MKKKKTLLFFTLLLLMNISCSEFDNSQDIGIDAVSVADSISYPDLVSDSIIETTATIEKSDSLSTRKYIYLTIDDAPLNGSMYIDSIISSEKIKTSLFVVGNAIDGSSRFSRYYKMLQQNPNIEIYNHSYSHANNRYVDFYKNPELVLEDFDKNQSDFDITHKITRLPGRNLWQIGERKKNYNQTGATSADLLVKNGYKVFGWDVEWNYDAKDYMPKQTIDELVEEIEASYNSSRTFTANHVVLLMHDQMFAKVGEKNDLRELITKLKDNNYCFEYLSAYPE
ncbi:polysaccharide deacetylase family protein [Dysgonomonas sp. HGC4]|uniref:polysaccharide deacetylase family protein n=1 Tax=Dysgonomonas sp. HGC4 TaxID=1658009 RepID=UPI0009E19CAE|nr:polysaccharide deacetylase family protein [Dysgonomonas sp. HGC4]MBD8346716.1 polysaccharide deacetylase family protein [Dysgonomonas sp. HGC4]